MWQDCPVQSHAQNPTMKMWAVVGKVAFIAFAAAPPSRLPAGEK